VVILPLNRKISNNFRNKQWSVAYENRLTLPNYPYPIKFRRIDSSQMFIGILEIMEKDEDRAKKKKDQRSGTIIFRKNEY